MENIIGQNNKEGVRKNKMKLSAALLIFAGLFSLSVASGNIGNVSVADLFLCLVCWFGAGSAFYGRRLGVQIATIIVFISFVIAVFTTPQSNWILLFTWSDVIKYLLFRGGLASILAILAYVFMGAAPTEASLSAADFQIQSKVNKQLKLAVLLSVLWLVGIGSLFSIFLARKAQKAISQADHKIKGNGMVWWSYIVGGLGVAYAVTIIVIGIMNNH